MTYEDITKAQAGLKTMPVHDKDYVQVNERVKAFRKLIPEGTIETQLISDDGGRCCFVALIKDAQGKLLSSGHAFEEKTVSLINKTSYIENCETSAVGRALAFLGIGIDTSIATAEEVDIAIRKQNLIKTEEKIKAEKRKSLPAIDKMTRAEMLEEILSQKPQFIEQVLNLKKNQEKGWKTTDDISEDVIKRSLSALRGD